MSESPYHFMQHALRHLIRRLLDLSTLQVTVFFVALAVFVSMVIVAVIDFSWDRRFNAELEFAGVVTPFLDGLVIVGLLVALLRELRVEVQRRIAAEDASRQLNEELEAKVRERTHQLLETQEELVRSEKLSLLAQVADNVGHELRNPLGVINNAVYFLQTVSSDSDETTKEYLNIIRDETANADRIVSDLLDAVRTKPPRQESVNVAEAIGQTLRKCEVPASVMVKMDMPQTLPPVRFDPMHLHQVFWNLITNAVEAMPDGGTLGIRLTAEPDVLRVSFTDTGCGMTAEQQARLFQPLFSTKARRVGLGLVVVKNLTQANGGSVAAESKAGKGSVFTVTLPAALEQH